MADTTSLEFEAESTEKTSAEHIVGINQQTHMQWLKQYLRKPSSLILLILLVGAATITLLALLFIIVYILNCCVL